MPYPNVEDVLCDLLESTATAVTWRDPDIALPYVFVRRVGGREDGFIDRPVVRVEVTADTYELARDLAATVRTKILTSGCTVVNGVQIDTADEVVATQQTPAFNPEDNNVTSTYVLSFRKH